MQIDLQGFLEEKSPLFMEELWKLLLSAQTEQTGIPKELIEEKKEEKERKLV
jgi:serine/arginine repetitive matrix protein 1